MTAIQVTAWALVCDVAGCGMRTDQDGRSVWLALESVVTDRIGFAQGDDGKHYCPEHSGFCEVCESRKPLHTLVQDNEEGFWQCRAHLERPFTDKDWVRTNGYDPHTPTRVVRPSRPQPVVAPEPEPVPEPVPEPLMTPLLDPEPEPVEILIPRFKDTATATDKIQIFIRKSVPEPVPVLLPEPEPEPVTDPELPVWVAEPVAVAEAAAEAKEEHMVVCGAPGCPSTVVVDEYAGWTAARVADPWQTALDEDWIEQDGRIFCPDHQNWCVQCQGWRYTGGMVEGINEAQGYFWCNWHTPHEIAEALVTRQAGPS